MIERLYAVPAHVPVVLALTVLALMVLLVATEQHTRYRPRRSRGRYRPRHTRLHDLTWRTR